LQGTEFVIQGSAVRTWKAGDPAPEAGIVKPTKSPDDIDVGIVLQPGQYENFKKDFIDAVEKMETSGHIKPELVDIIASRIKYSKDKIMYRKIFDKIKMNSGKTFVDELRASCDNFTSFETKDINFAIIKKYDESDILPIVTFKY
jgi:hypothetical protein